MSNLPLEQFATKAMARSRITFGDVCRLRRDILPGGIAFRDEAELLIRVDRHVGRSDAAWTDWLTRSIVEFAVWGERQPGCVAGDTVRWLTEELMRQGPLTRAGHRIVREARLEAENPTESVIGLDPSGHQDLEIQDQMAA
jgi:hypothetical protein